MPSREPSITFQVISPTSATAASVARPATTCRMTSPKRTRRPVKGRRDGATSGVMSAADTESLSMNLCDRLFVDREHRLRHGLEEDLRPVRLALRDRPEEELLQVGRLRRLERDDGVGEGADRV